MLNYLCLNGKKIAIPEEFLKEICENLAPKTYNFKITKENGRKIVKIGSYDFIVLEKTNDTVALLLADCLKHEVFGSNNDFRESNVRMTLQSFAEEIEKLVGTENLLEHTVDLTSIRGLKDYGTVKAKMSLLTFELYNKYIDVLNINKPKTTWWLATPQGSEKGVNDHWVQCASFWRDFDFSLSPHSAGVRPFCILNSKIFTDEESITPPKCPGT